jgi:hypothetical protein
MGPFPLGTHRVRRAGVDGFTPLDRRECVFAPGSSILRAMKKIIPVAVAFALVWAWARWSGADRGEAPSADPSHVSSVLEERAPAGYDSAPRAGSQFQSEGTVVRVLSDDNEGSRHQRFIVRLASGRTVLIAHNIDLAPRVDGLETGDTVEFSGEF